MVSPTSGSSPIHHPEHSAVRTFTFPPPIVDTDYEKIYIPRNLGQPYANFAHDSAALTQLIYSLNSFKSPLSQIGLISEIITQVYTCLGEFQAYVNDAGPSIFTPDSSGVAPIQRLVGYRGFYGFVQGGTTFSPTGSGTANVPWDGFFSETPEAGISVNKGLIIPAITASDISNNASILAQAWAIPEGSDSNGNYIAHGFLNYALDLGEANQTDGANLPTQNTIPSPYFNNSGVLVPPTPPTGWPSTIPYITNLSDPSLFGGTSVVTMLNQQMQTVDGEPLYHYYQNQLSPNTATTINLNLGYWTNMTVLCIKAMINGETSKIPNFATLLMNVFNSWRAMTASGCLPLDPATSAFLNTFFYNPDPNLPGNDPDPNVPGNSVEGIILLMEKSSTNQPLLQTYATAITSYFQGKTPTGADDIYSPFYSSGGNTVGSFLFGLHGNLASAWGQYCTNNWIINSLTAK